MMGPQSGQLYDGATERTILWWCHSRADNSMMGSQSGQLSMMGPQSGQLYNTETERTTLWGHRADSSMRRPQSGQLYGATERTTL